MGLGALAGVAIGLAVIACGDRPAAVHAVHAAPEVAGGTRPEPRSRITAAARCPTPNAVALCLQPSAPTSTRSTPTGSPSCSATTWTKRPLFAGAEAALESATTWASYDEAIYDLLARFHDGHLTYHPPSSARPATGWVNYRLGLETVLANDRLLIAHVERGSAFTSPASCRAMRSYASTACRSPTCSRRRSRDERGRDPSRPPQRGRAAGRTSSTARPKRRGPEHCRSHIAATARRSTSSPRPAKWRASTANRSPSKLPGLSSR